MNQSYRFAHVELESSTTSINLTLQDLIYLCPVIFVTNSEIHLGFFDKNKYFISDTNGCVPVSCFMGLILCQREGWCVCLICKRLGVYSAVGVDQSSPRFNNSTST